MHSHVRSWALAALVLATVAADASAAPPFVPPGLFHPPLLVRPDVRKLPLPLKLQLATLDLRPHTYPPLPVFAEADTPSQLFGYYKCASVV